MKKEEANETLWRQYKGKRDTPIPEDVYPVIDTDLGRDNVENDLSAADLQDLQ